MPLRYRPRSKFGAQQKRQHAGMDGFAKTQLKIPGNRRCWRYGAVMFSKCQSQPMTYTELAALQELIDSLDDKYMSSVILYVEQCIPGCIVDDDGSVVDLDLSNANTKDQHRLVMYVERMAHLDRSCWRSGAVMFAQRQSQPMTYTELTALQELIDNLDDKCMSSVILYMKQCLPGCIVDDGGTVVDLDLSNANPEEQHRLATYVERIAHLDN